MSRLLPALLFSGLTLHAGGSLAESDRVDYDLDNDGLIEINDLADLNDIRNHLDGSALYGSSMGCPETGCNGFELSTNLDFDTNGSGVADAGDTYWNGGEGWQPIGEHSYDDHLISFHTTFEGNGYSISNLYIDRVANSQGLFAKVYGAKIERLFLTDVYVSAQWYSAALTGRAQGGSEIKEVLVSGRVEGQHGNVGGIIGGSSDASCTACVMVGKVSGAYAVGALIGDSHGDGGRIRASLSLAEVEEDKSQVSTSYADVHYGYGGLMGKGLHGEIEASLNVGYVGPDFGALTSHSATLTNSYWALDATGSSTAGNGSTLINTFGTSLEQLKCPQAANNETCTDAVLYQGWDLIVNDRGQPYWDFGKSGQLPGLRIAGRIIRDSDGDGQLDTTAVDNDFNGDGKTDLLLLNSDVGSVKVWQMDGVDVAANNYISGQSGWEIALTADFNGDGRSDIALQNPTLGAIKIWQMAGTEVAASKTYTEQHGWNVDTAADLNGDGRSDLVLVNAASGEIKLWQMNGTQVVAGKLYSGQQGFTLSSSADFNGDGNADLVLQSAEGIKLWLLDGVELIEGRYISGLTGWKLVQ